jgi:hypothetical protein
LGWLDPRSRRSLPPTLYHGLPQNLLNHRKGYTILSRFPERPRCSMTHNTRHFPFDGLFDDTMTKHPQSMLCTMPEPAPHPLYNPTITTFLNSPSPSLPFKHNHASHATHARRPVTSSSPPPDTLRPISTYPPSPSNHSSSRRRNCTLHHQHQLHNPLNKPNNFILCDEARTPRKETCSGEESKPANALSCYVMLLISRVGFFFPNCIA